MFLYNHSKSHTPRVNWTLEKKHTLIIARLLSNTDTSN